MRRASAGDGYGHERARQRTWRIGGSGGSHTGRIPRARPAAWAGVIMSWIAIGLAVLAVVAYIAVFFLA